MANEAQTLQGFSDKLRKLRQKLVVYRPVKAVKGEHEASFLDVIPSPSHISNDLCIKQTQQDANQYITI